MATSALRARGSIVAALITAVVVAAACAPAPAPSAATTEPSFASLLPSPCERADRKRRTDRRHNARAGRSPRLRRHGRTPGPRRLHDLARRCRRGYGARFRGRDRRVRLPGLVARREAPRDDAGRRHRPRDRDHRPDVPGRAARGKRGHLREPTAQPFYLSWRPDSKMVSFLAQETDGLSLRIAPVDASAPLDGSGPDAIIRTGNPFYFDWIGSDRLLAHIGSGAGGVPRRVRARRRRAGWRARRAGRVPLAGHQPRRRARGRRSGGRSRRGQAGLPAPRSPSRSATANPPRRCR